MAQTISREGGEGQNCLRPDKRHPAPPRPRKIVNIFSPRGQHPSPPAEHGPSGNGLLDALPRAEYSALRPSLEPIGLPQGAVLYEPEERVSHVYFPTGALVSLFVTTESGATVEAGLACAEGVVGLPVLWGADKMPYLTVVQHGGSLLRMRADVFRRAAQCPTKLHELLLRYTNFSFNCAAQTAACNRLHTVEERTASWLLVMSDRLAGDELPLTHELIARSLGVRRAGVSVAVSGFERENLLRCKRARISISDRRGLAGRACECYRSVKAEYECYRKACADAAAPRPVEGLNDFKMWPEREMNSAWL